MLYYQKRIQVHVMKHLPIYSEVPL